MTIKEEIEEFFIEDEVGEDELIDVGDHHLDFFDRYDNNCYNYGTNQLKWRNIDERPRI